jgi:nonribosomal peptide synthetase protein BlmIV
MPDPTLISGLTPELAGQVAALPPEQRARLEELVRAKLGEQAGIGPAAGDGPWPASFGQERMWVGEALTPAGHNYATALRLAGPLWLPALRASLLRIVARHEVLRSTFELAGDRLVQRVHQDPRLPFQLVDLCAAGAVPGGPLPPLVHELLRDAAQRPFDLAAGPLLRVVTIRLGPGDHVVLLVIHHTVTDGWSNGVLAGELSAGYQDLLAGRPWSLDPPGLQYRDYAAWQRGQLSSPEMAELSAFWREATRDLPRLDLPTDAGTQPPAPATGATHVLTLDQETSGRLARLHAAEGSSRFILVLAGLAAVLRAVTGQPDLVLGTLAAGRTRPEFARLIGYFVNVLLLRLRVPGRLTFRQLWELVRRQAQEAFAHQEMPFESVLPLLRGQQEAGPASPIRVLCVPHDEPPAVELPGLAAEPLDVEIGNAPFDLVVEVRQRAGCLQIAFQYDVRLLAAGTVRQLAGLLGSALRRVAADPSVACEDLFAGDAPADAAARPDGLPSPLPAAPDDTLHARFEARAAACPAAVAVTDGESCLSYGMLNARSNQLARHLRALGVRAEDRVGVCLPRSAGSVIALLAVLKAGGAYVALDPAHPVARRAAIAADAGITVMITSSEVARRDQSALAGQGPPDPAAPVLTGPVLTGHVLTGPVLTDTVLTDTDSALIAACPAGDLRLPGRGDQAAYLVYTSGSTGRPKAVAGLHRGALGRARWMQRRYPVTPGEVCALRTPVSFVDSVWETFGPLLAGATLAVIPPDQGADPVLLAGRLAAMRVTRLVAVPALIRMLLDAVPALGSRLPLLATWLTSGEELPAELVSRLLQAAPGCLLLNLYGSSEVSADVTAAALRRPVPAGVPIGTPIDGVTAWAGDRQARALPTLACGEIYVGGDAVARGYHRRPGQTAQVFLPDPYGPPGARLFRTGDRGRLRPDGQLSYLGRTDAQIQVRGHRVEPAEVEEVLLAHPAVRAAAVAAARDSAGSVTLAGYVVFADQYPEPPVAGLRDFLHARLPGYLVPSLLLPVTSLPRTDSGKLDRPALAPAPPPRPAGGRPPAGQAPSPGPESVIAAAFAEVLGLDQVGVGDDFFLTGGHSILAGRLTALLSERLGLRVGLADLFAAPTVAALAGRLAGLAPAAPDQAPAARPLRPDPARWHEPFPLTDVQQAYYVGRSSDLPLGGVSTHAYLEVAVDDLDPGRFTAALRALIQRHPMLRAVIRPDGTQQVLATVPDYQVQVRDLRALGAEERQQRLAAARTEMSHQLLGPHTWPLFDVRASLLPGPGGESGPAPALLHVSVDSLICDAYSFGLVMDELARRYAEPHWSPPALEVAFSDYVRHQATGRDTARYAEALSYWRERVAALPTGPELPSGRPLTGGHRFTRRNGGLGAADWATLKQRATAAGVTPSVLLLAAFAEVISHWSRRPHYSLMLTVFNRAPLHPQVDDIVGDFTSLIPLEVDHRASGPFLRRAQELQRQLWSDLDHSAVSAVTVIREWALARGIAPQPITPVVFTSNLPVAAAPASRAPASGGQRPAIGTLGYAITQTPQVHLDHQVSEQDGELLFSWDAAGEVFAPGVLDGMFAAYRELLAALAARPGDWELPVRPGLPAAQAARRAAANGTRAPQPARCLHEAVGDAAARQPDRPAVIDGAVRMTYGQLVACARRIGRTLRSRGARPGSLVGVAAQRGWQQVAAALGVLESGAAFLPLDPQLPAQRLRHLMDRGELSLVLTQRAIAGQLPRADGVTLLAVDDADAWDSDDRPLAPAQGPGDLAYVIFTSGSTGEPKGVAIDHRGAANTIASVSRRFGIGPDDRVLAVSSLGFDLAVYDIFGTLAAGGAVVLPEHDRRRDPGHWASLVRRERVTVWNSVPALAELLAGHAEALDPDALASLRVILLSGDWIPVRLPDRLRALTGAQVISLGGATEGSIWSVWYPVGDVDGSWPSIPYGTPLPNQSMHVLDGQLEPRPDGVPGELYIGGMGVALGYWRDPEQTSSRFIVHPVTGERLYRTGDIARYLPDGNLEFLGREDSQVKINGYRIELGEIEAALVRLPQVRSAAVVAAGAPGAGRRLAGLLVPADRGDFDLRQVTSGLAQVLPGYMIPGSWTVLDELPLTANGKVDAAALQRLAAGAGAAPAPAAVPAAPPDSRLIAELGQLWQTALPGAAAGPQDNFFALGGTSLTAIRLLTQVQESFGVHIPLPDLFAAPTVTALAAVIAQARRVPAAEQLPAARPDPAARYDPFPLTDIQQAYWLGRRAQNALGGVATHSYSELEVSDLDLPRLESALTALVRRHDALRTVVRPDGRQQVLASVPRYRIPCADLRGLAAAAAGQQRRTLRARMSHEVRDVSRWPLFEIQAQRTGDACTRLHVSFDLLIVDARSMRILTSELMALYADPAAELRPLGLTFRDFLATTGELRGSDAYRRAWRYWQSRLADIPPAPVLPLACPPEDISSAAFSRLTGGLDEAPWQALRSWAGELGLTPSTVVCTAFCAVLAAYSESPRFTVNLTTFNRLPVHPDTEALVGDFTTTTLLAVEYAGESFAGNARRVQEQTWRDLEHRLVSGVEVQRMLRRDPARRAAAMMPVVFTSALFPDDVAPPDPESGWSARPVYSVSQTPQVLLDHQASEQAGRLACSWDFAQAAFPPGLVEGMFETFIQLMRSLADQAQGCPAQPGEVPA